MTRRAARSAFVARAIAWDLFFFIVGLWTLVIGWTAVFDGDSTRATAYMAFAMACFLNIRAAK